MFNVESTLKAFCAALLKCVLMRFRIINFKFNLIQIFFVLILLNSAIVIKC